MSDDDEPQRVDSDEDEGFNPLAEAMGLSAESVAASTRAEDDLLGPSATAASRAPANSGSARGKGDGDAGLSSFARGGSSSSGSAVPAAASSARSAPAPRTQAPAVRDEFDDVLDAAALGSMRGGVTATSQGYINPKDLDTIRQAQAREAAKKKQQQQQEPVVDEFDNLDDVSPDLLAVEKLSLAAKPAASSSAAAAAQFDEFADVWEDTSKALAGSAPAAGAGGRKVLKASREQQKVEKPNAREEARMAAEREREAARKREEAEAREREEKGLQNATLAKLGIGPTTILAQYDRDPNAAAAAAASPTSGSSAAAKKQSIRAEQRTLERNDAVLASSAPATAAAASSASSPAAAAASSSSASSAAAPASKPNVVDALVSAHVVPSALDSSLPEVAAELQQWGAVNDLREKQIAAAAEEARRAKQQAAAGGSKHMGIKAADAVSRDTPITYDSALRSLTLGPSPESEAASLAQARAVAEIEGKPFQPPQPHAEYMKSLQSRIQIYDFRNIGAARNLRFKMFGPPKLGSERLEKEREHVFCLALSPVDHARSIDHERMLLSLYRGLTGDALAPPTYGQHWTLIGFQGNDPATDLRGAGLFSLVQLLWFLKHHRELMLRIFQLSQDDRQNFPFATLSTNLSGMVLQAMRETYKLYGEIARRNSVWDTLNELYGAAFYDVYLRWKRGNLTIVDWNDTRQLVEEQVLHNPKALIKQFVSGQHGGGAGGEAPEPLQFTEIP